MCVLAKRVRPTSRHKKRRANRINMRVIKYNYYQPEKRQKWGLLHPTATKMLKSRTEKFHNLLSWILEMTKIQGRQDYNARNEWKHLERTAQSSIAEGNQLPDTEEQTITNNQAINQSINQPIHQSIDQLWCSRQAFSAFRTAITWYAWSHVSSPATFLRGARTPGRPSERYPRKALGTGQPLRHHSESRVHREPAIHTGSAGGGRSQAQGEGGALAVGVSRCTLHVLRLTFHVSHFTFHSLPFPLHV